MEGLEPPHLTASDPKSDVSTNFTTSGNIVVIKERKGKGFKVFEMAKQGFIYKDDKTR